MSKANNHHTCLVTGATGFVGRALCSYLQTTDIRVVACGRSSKPSGVKQPWTTCHQFDIGDAIINPVIFEGVDTVIHLAGMAHVHSLTEDSREQFFHVNTRGTENILRAAEKAGVRSFVLLSTVAVLGSGGKDCLDETAPIDCQNDYAESKREAEKLVMASSIIAHRSIIRAPLVYGPACPGNLNRMIHMVKKGHFPPLPNFTNRRSMIHVDDLARALYQAATDPRANNNIFHVSDGLFYSTTDIYRWILGALKKPVPRWHVPFLALKLLAKTGSFIEKITGRSFVFSEQELQKLIGSACYETIKINQLLNFVPQHNLKVSMQEIVNSLDKPPPN